MGTDADFAVQFSVCTFPDVCTVHILSLLLTAWRYGPNYLHPLKPFLSTFLLTVRGVSGPFLGPSTRAMQLFAPPSPVNEIGQFGVSNFRAEMDEKCFGESRIFEGKLLDFEIILCKLYGVCWVI